MSDTNLEVPQAYALTANWLEQAAAQNTTLTVTGNVSGLSSATQYCWPSQSNWSNSWWYTPTPYHRPIKLGLSEVEKLRASAKRDAKLKKILEKFTDLIEVTVDFK